MANTSSKAATPKASSGFSGFLDTYFQISERGSTVGREIRGGLVTFFAMSYIIILNPLILGLTPDSTGAYLGAELATGDPTTVGGGLPLIAATTALIAGILSIMMGAVAKFPIALAAGLGLNALVAYTIVKMPGMTWADGMGLVVLEGLVILVLVLTGFRTAVFRAVPAGLKTAISVGIGLFIAFIGLVNAGVVTTPAMFDYIPGNQPGTPVQLGTDKSIDSLPMLVFFLGLFAIVLLTARKVKGAMLWSILGATVLAVVLEQTLNIGAKNQGAGAGDNPTGWNLNAPAIPDSWFALPDFSLIGQFSLFGSFGKIGIVAVILLVFSLVLADFFDTMGTMVAVGGEAGLLDKEGNPPNIQSILVVDSLGAIAGGAGSVSSNTAFIESASGVGEGARTGLASIVTGLAFLAVTLFAPVVQLVPYEAATPALVFVGFLMMTQVTGIKWSDYEIALPAFLTMVIMPFTYSITDGIGAGFLFWTAIKLVKGKGRSVHPLMWVTTAMFVIYFALGPIQDALVG
ncbi:NCS2 family permease [Jonesia quinghaiensis]|uniref:NCS2 family permease n=1 Tax=Jonesia quinghaiensis TaxID=262806 RepID=UPI000420A1B7|nr:NCS2 family permease [Jonesia quinghaiensis]